MTGFWKQVTGFWKQVTGVWEQVTGFWKEVTWFWNWLTSPLKPPAPHFHPGPNVIKLFTAVIYRHSMVMPSFCVIKQHYLGNYCRMAVNYHRNIYNIEFTLE
jgi:hypothetical protein